MTQCIKEKFRTTHINWVFSCCVMHWSNYIDHCQTPYEHMWVVLLGSFLQMRKLSRQGTCPESHSAWVVLVLAPPKMDSTTSAGPGLLTCQGEEKCQPCLFPWDQRGQQYESVLKSTEYLIEGGPRGIVSPMYSISSLGENVSHWVVQNKLLINTHYVNEWRNKWWKNLGLVVSVPSQYKLKLLCMNNFALQSLSSKPPGNAQ